MLLWGTSGSILDPADQARIFHDGCLGEAFLTRAVQTTFGRLGRVKPQ